MLYEVLLSTGSARPAPKHSSAGHEQRCHHQMKRPVCSLPSAPQVTPFVMPAATSFTDPWVFSAKKQMTESCKRRELPQSTRSTAHRANAPSPPGLSQPWQPPPACKHFVLPAIPRTLRCWPFHHVEPNLRTTEPSLRTTEPLATGSATDRAGSP